MKRLWIALGLIAAVLVAAVAYIRFSPTVAQDTCLDGGGAWHAGQCVGRRPNG